MKLQPARAGANTMLYCIGMADAANDLKRFLEELIGRSKAGDRLPTIRELMRRFGVSQAIVQRVFSDMKSQGLIASEVGRGTYIRHEGASQHIGSGDFRETLPTSGRSILLLRRSVSVARGRILLEDLRERFVNDGHQVLELTYTDWSHARGVLKGLPRFDACVIQSTFKSIPVDLLAALHDRCDTLAVDGAALVGADVDAVGMEWGGPLEQAVTMLRQQGHRSIAFASTSYPLLATQLGARRFTELQSRLGDCELHLIELPHLPSDDYATALVQTLRERLDPQGKLPFTALAAWGIEDGAGFRSELSALGIRIPSTLSVILLGRTDLPNEHSDFFDTIGCSVADQAAALYQSLCDRWAHPSNPYGLRLIPVTQRKGQSTAAPTKVSRTKARAATCG